MTLQDRLIAHEKQGDELLKAIRAEYPIGRLISWEHGSHEVCGRIIQHGGFQLDHADFKVRSRTGKEYWVSVWRVRGIKRR